VAGVVEELGEGVAGIAAGAPVVIANSAPCDVCEFCRGGRQNLCDDLLFWNGAYAEFSLVPARIVARNLLPLPPGLPLRSAALTEPLACVVRGVEECDPQPGETAAVIGSGPIGLMFVSLLRARGARVVAAGRRRERLEKAIELGAAAVVAADEPEALARSLRAESPDGRGPHVVIEAVGSAATSEAALGAVRKGGRVNLFGGCPAGTLIGVDAQRLHYEELTVFASFHHTPRSFREALRLIAEKRIDAEALIGGEASLDRLPELLREMASGAVALKIAVVP
jgi:L-iditol 2-dehydrogenase